MRFFTVGGCVRDKLMGVEPKDIDFVVLDATAEQMLDSGFRQVGADFPVFLNEHGQEFALPRREVSTGPGYNDFKTEVVDTLVEDLWRRDLTINAMAMDDSGNLVDPFNGQADLNSKVLRHVSRAFTEDPVRVLRVARFAARFPDFVVAHGTRVLMLQMVKAGMLDNLTRERVWAEMEKALGEAEPSRFFKELEAVGALTVIFPELSNLRGVPQVAEHHPEIDTFVHTMMCLDQAQKLGCDVQTMFAVLVHDLGKGTTPRDVLPQHIGHEVRSADLIDVVCNRLRVPNKFKRLAVLVALYHTKLHGLLSIKKMVKVVDLLDKFPSHDVLVQFIMACEADARGRLGFEDREYPQAYALLLAASVVNSVTAKQLIYDGIEPGPQMGEALRIARATALRQSRVLS